MERRIEVKIFGSDGEVIFNDPYLVGDLCNKKDLQEEALFLYPWGHYFDRVCVNSSENGGDYFVAAGWRVIFAEGDEDYLNNLPVNLTVKNIEEAMDLVFPLIPIEQ
ncbi:MAG TPA: hypothetical protein V6D48_20390 [Oculatellaceae cyanobacterium]